MIIEKKSKRIELVGLWKIKKLKRWLGKGDINEKKMKGKIIEMK